MANEMEGAAPSEQVGSEAGAPRDRRIWVPPRLVRLGSVAQVTAKVDFQGRNDGGSFLMSRT
jgi:hypothetical protein